MATILHITWRDSWQDAIKEGIYVANSFKSEGFIHCSTPEQVIEIADLNFPYEENLVLLEIDSEKVRYEIRYENLEGEADLYPHIYGPIELNAVKRVHDFKKDKDNKFHLPVGIY